MLGLLAKTPWIKICSCNMKSNFSPLEKLPKTAGKFPNEVEARRRMFSTAEHDRVELCASARYSAPPQQECSKSWRLRLGI